MFTANGLDAGGGIVISGTTIEELVPTGEPASLPCDKVFDAGRHVLLPGLINTHHHFHQTLTRAWAPVANAELFPWFKTLYPVWARLTPQDLMRGSMPLGENDGGLPPQSTVQDADVILAHS